MKIYLQKKIIHTWPNGIYTSKSNYTIRGKSECGKFHGARLHPMEQMLWVREMPTKVIVALGLMEGPCVVTDYTFMIILRCFHQ